MKPTVSNASEAQTRVMPFPNFRAMNSSNTKSRNATEQTIPHVAISTLANLTILTFAKKMLSAIVARLIEQSTPSQRPIFK